MNLKTIAGFSVLSSLLFGCLPGKQANASVGVDCPPQSPVTKDCHNLLIVSHPFTPESASPQLSVQAYDPSFEAIIRLTPKLLHFAKGFGFSEDPVF